LRKTLRKRTFIVSTRGFETLYYTGIETVKVTLKVLSLSKNKRGIAAEVTAMVNTSDRARRFYRCNGKAGFNKQEGVLC